MKNFNLIFIHVPYKKIIKNLELKCIKIKNNCAVKIGFDFNNLQFF